MDEMDDVDEMDADRIIAALLTAGMLAASTSEFNATEKSAKHAVALYRQVLAALAENAPMGASS
jgi:hypothetical protein